MGKSPSIILTSQYTIPNKKSFTTYVDYCMRQKALLKEGHTLTNTELTELSRLQNAIDSFDMERGSPHSNQKKVSVSEKEAEAKVLLTSPNSFNTTTDFEKYVSYMGRKYALESKKKMTKTEEEEVSLLTKHIEDLSPEQMQEKIEAEEILSGVFSKNKNVITSADLNEIKELVGKAQNKGSVYYQDVISFD
ncbi:relaxase MobL, partial [Bacillus cereus]